MRWTLFLVPLLMLSGCVAASEDVPAGQGAPASPEAQTYQTVEIATGGDTMGAVTIDGTPVQAPGFYVEVTVPAGALDATLEVTRSVSTTSQDDFRFQLGACGWVDVPAVDAGVQVTVTFPVCSEPQEGEQKLSYNISGASQFTFRLLAEVPA